MGEDTFIRGLTDYLNEYGYGNVGTSDLSRALDGRYTGVNVTRLLDTWSRQGGYPLLYVQPIAGSNNTSYKLTQTRYLSNPQQTLDENHSPYK